MACFIFFTARGDELLRQAVEADQEHLSSAQHIAISQSGAALARNRVNTGVPNPQAFNSPQADQAMLCTM